MNLLEKLASLKVDARKQLDAYGESGNQEDFDRGVKLREEAEGVAKAIEEMSKLDGIKMVASEPIRPPLPGVGVGVMPQPAEQEKPVNQAMKAAYVTKFGSEDTLIKSILTELHGADYMGLYWGQKSAFNKYLRAGEQALTQDDRRLMRGIVYTPAAVKAALEQGIYDVGVLKSTMVEGRDELGGYTVPVDFQARVIERLVGFTVIRPRATVLRTSRDMVSIPVSTGGDDQYTSAVRVTWVDETPSATQAESNLTFGMENIAIHTAMVTTPISRNLLEDAFFPLEGFLAQKFAESAGIDEDNKFLVGAGGASPLGILPNSANTLGLTEEDTGHATLLTWDGAGAAAGNRGLVGLTYALAAQYMSRAVWIMERATAEVIRTMKDGAGNYLWEPDQKVGQPLNLLGYPVLMQEAMPSIAAQAFPIIFGDLAGYYIADRVGMTVERFLDSATASTNTVKFVMRRRLGGQVAESYRLAVQQVST